MDHFALKEKEAYDYTRNIISTLNFQLPAEEEEMKRRRAEEQPLYSSEELLGLASKSYNYSLDVKMVQCCVIRRSARHSLWQIMMWLVCGKYVVGPSHDCFTEPIIYERLLVFTLCLSR